MGIGMRRTGIAHLPLHTGHAPRWLFSRMVSLGKSICEALIDEFSHAELLRRLSDPYFFQAFGCVLGFDWHSSGLTTTVGGALKQALVPKEHGICVAGGKRESRKAPEEIGTACELWNVSSAKAENLVYASRISAKVDNALVQDSYNIYAHFFFLTEKGEWAVIQQGMNSNVRYARRYHWLCDTVASYVESPHQAICCDHTAESLDLTSEKNKDTRTLSVDLVRDGVGHLTKYFDMRQRSLLEYMGNAQQVPRFTMPQDSFRLQGERGLRPVMRSLTLPPRHFLNSMSKRNLASLKAAEELQPRTYEELVAIRGIGAKSLRALALISELVYGNELDWKDPARFSFAHGGKDGIPYPVDKPVMDRSIQILNDAVHQARLGDRERLRAINSLRRYSMASA